MVSTDTVDLFSWDSGQVPRDEIELHRFDEHTVTVRFPSSDDAHAVTLEDGEPDGCSCKDYEYRKSKTGNDCKHMAIVREELETDGGIEMEDQDTETDEQEQESENTDQDDVSTDETVEIQLELSDPRLKESAFRMLAERVRELEDEKRRIDEQIGELTEQMKRIEESTEIDMPQFEESVEDEVEVTQI